MRWRILSFRKKKRLSSTRIPSSQQRDFSSKQTQKECHVEIDFRSFKCVDQLFDIVNPDHTMYETKSRNSINRREEREFRRKLPNTMEDCSDVHGNPIFYRSILSECQYQVLRKILQFLRKEKMCSNESNIFFTRCISD